MATYCLVTHDGGHFEFEAPSESEALQVASETIRANWKPKGRSTYWVDARLFVDYDIRVADWLEPIHPNPPDCNPPTEKLENADNRELERLWKVRAREEDGHLWAREGVIVKDVCLRCGTLRTVDTETRVEHPVTGREELRHIEYEPGRYAAEVEGVFSADEERRS